MLRLRYSEEKSTRLWNIRVWCRADIGQYLRFHRHLTQEHVAWRWGDVRRQAGVARYSAAVAIGSRGQDGLRTGCHHLAMPKSRAITLAAL